MPCSPAPAVSPRCVEARKQGQVHARATKIQDQQSDHDCTGTAMTRCVSRRGLDRRLLQALCHALDLPLIRFYIASLSTVNRCTYSIGPKPPHGAHALHFSISISKRRDTVEKANHQTNVQWHKTEVSLATYSMYVCTRSVFRSSSLCPCLLDASFSGGTETEELLRAGGA